MEKPLVNRVANSGLITINLRDYYPEEDIVTLDLKDYLFKELILKEADFRDAMKTYDWASLEGKFLLVTCSTDAIIPMWAYMLVGSYAAPHAVATFEGSMEQFLSHLIVERFEQDFDAEKYRGERIILKGCSDKSVPAHVYLHATSRLRSLAKSIMYGEPCSTVPIFKAPKRALTD